MPNREDALIEALNEVSDPEHQKYRAHLTKEQVADLVASHQDTPEIVHSWLEHHGVPSSSISMSHGGSWLTIASAPVSQADKLLCASYQLYRHTGVNETETILRTVSYALPLTLHAHVQTVAPTTHFASPRTSLQALYGRSSEEAAVTVNATSGRLVRAPSERDGYITPSFLRWLYKTQAYTPAAMSQNVLGTLGFLEDYPSPTDLTQFMTNFRADAEAATFTIVEVNGGEYDASHPGMAGSVHTQYTEAMAYPTPHIYYITGGMFWWSPLRPLNSPIPGDAYLEWLNYLLAQQNIPSTISIPYANSERYILRGYARALCRLFAQLGTRGVSVTVSSPGAATTVSAVETAFPGGPPTASGSFPRSPHPALESLLSAARRVTTPRSRQSSPGAASRSTLRARATREPKCPPFSFSSYVAPRSKNMTGRL